VSYPNIVRALKEMIRAEVLHPLRARGIFRKSDFRGGSFAEASSQGTPILSVPPRVIAATCPRAPYGSASIQAMSEEEREDFYETVALAETGDAGALEAIHDYLIAFGLEDTIVLNYILEMARYDWDGTPATFPFNPTAACPIEIDVALHPNAFWEQYKTGDTRFDDNDLTPVPANRDWRTIIKSFTFRSREADMETPHTEVNLNSLADVPYPECPPTLGAVDDITHNEDAVFTEPHVSLGQPTGIITVGYRKRFGSSSVAFPSPRLCFTTERMLANKVSPEKDNAHVGTGPDFGIYESSALSAINKFTVNQPSGSIPYYIDTRWRQCVDFPPGLETTLECYAALVPELFPPSSSVDSSTTYANYRFYREPPIGRVTIDWTEDPPIGETSMVRYDFSWPTFEVVALRMSGDVPALAAGTYLYP
jgi:hypothetical protein